MTQTFDVPNGILFVLDPNNYDADIPEYDPDAPTAATSTCVSVAAQADVDGPVRVSLDRAAEGGVANEGLTTVFRGSIETPTLTFAVITTGYSRKMELPVRGALTEFSVWVDEFDAPSVVRVIVDD